MRGVFSCTAGDGHCMPTVPARACVRRLPARRRLTRRRRSSRACRRRGLRISLPAQACDESRRGDGGVRVRIEKVPPHERRPEAFFVPLRDARCSREARRPARRGDGVAAAADRARDRRPGSSAGRSGAGRSLGAARLRSSAPPRLPRAGRTADRAPFWERLGLEPDPWSGEYRGPYIDICPPSFQDASPPEGTRVLHIRPATPAAADPVWRDRLGGDRPVVYVTLGRIFNDPGALHHDFVRPRRCQRHRARDDRS